MREDPLFSNGEFKQTLNLLTYESLMKDGNVKELYNENEYEKKMNVKKINEYANINSKAYQSSTEAQGGLHEYNGL